MNRGFIVNQHPRMRNLMPTHAPLFGNDAKAEQRARECAVKKRTLSHTDDAIRNRSHDSSTVITGVQCARRILLTIVNEENCAGASTCAPACAFIGYPHKFTEWSSLSAAIAARLAASLARRDFC